MRIAISLLTILLSVHVFAQEPIESQLLKKMDLGYELMEQGKYEEADETFRYVLKNITKVPSELAYYFGRNSYHLEKYKQSINWLNKYIQLKGTQGRYYNEATKYLQLAEDAYIKIARQKSEEFQKNLESGEYDCDGLSKMICPVCKGEGVVVKPGPFDLIYKTCPYSVGEGYLTCEEYNQFMRGELQPKIK